MIDGFRILGLIPARAGSKGIIGKNTIDLAGKPLIAYTIEAAINSHYIDNVIVSTDGEHIAEVAKAYGAAVPFLRPAEYASDTAKTIDVLLHALNELSAHGEQYQILCLLQPTSPLRTSEDIDKAIECFVAHGQRGLVSVSEATDHPLLLRSIETSGVLKSLLDKNSTCRRQDMPSFYRVNGAIYLNQVSELNPEISLNDNPIPFILDKTHAIDIDDILDLKVAELFQKL